MGCGVVVEWLCGSANTKTNYSLKYFTPPSLIQQQQRQQQQRQQQQQQQRRNKKLRSFLINPEKYSLAPEKMLFAQKSFRNHTKEKFVSS